MEKMDAVENGEVTEDWQNMGDMKERLSYLAEHMDAISTNISFTAGPNKLKILAHKFMLGLGSPVFHSMFFGKLKEDDGEIDIPDVDADAFQFFIRYLYTGQIDGMSMENVMRIMYCGKKYWVESLLDKCRLFVQENLSVDSACEVLHMADLLEEKTMSELTSIFLARSAFDIFQSPDWVLIGENTLVNILQMADLDADEIRVYEAAKRWVEHASANLQTNEEKKQLASRIFKHVRMPLLTPSQIANGPAVDQILGPAELMDIYAFKFADKKPEIAYDAEPRTPRPDTFFVSFELLADIRTDTSVPDEEEEEEEDMDFGIRETFVTVQLGKVTVEVRADIVPATSKFFFRLCDDDLKFRIMYGDVEFERHGTTETKLGKMKVFPRENNLLKCVWQGPGSSGAGLHCYRPKVCATFENDLAQIICSRRKDFRVVPNLLCLSQVDAWLALLQASQGWGEPQR
ncbi:hypothetical protein RvY_19301-2 [Ramazzottius varieornatus]|uniref:BTB domain-containing protein n=1 Tax=Ramazzottius varieornatus TaxID=947166 RepID=A0A1D1WBT5_RAMVA|nr:hypothetical protein RvY_19301-2 [Ramazzottius varieornatus]